MAWQTGGGMLVPSSRGTDLDWYRNTIAAGGCDIQLRGHWYRCTAPRLIEKDEALSYLSASTRTVSRLFPVRQFLLLAKAQPQG